MKFNTYALLKNICCCCIFIICCTTSNAQVTDIEWFYDLSLSSYPDFCEEGQIVIRIENRNDSIEEDAYNLVLRAGFAEEMISTPQRHECVSLYNFRIERPGANMSVIPDPDINSNYTLNLNFDEDPDGEGGLADLDGDGVFDDLPAGEQTFLIMNVQFEETCLRSCPPVIIPPQFLRLRIQGTNSDEEAFTLNQLNDSPIVNFGFFAEEQSTYGELDQSYQCEEEVTLNIFLDKFMIDMSPICPNELSKLYLIIPPTLLPNGDPFDYDTQTTLPFQMEGDTMVICGNFTSADLFIPFVVQADDMSSSCTSADSVGHLYTIPYWLNYFCNSDNCENSWQLYCGTSNAFSVDCNEPPQSDVSGIFTQSFSSERITLGWTDASMTQAVEASSTDLRLDNALTFDKIKWTATATVGVTVPTDSLAFHWQYQALGNNNSLIFDYLEGTFRFFKNSTQTWQECNLDVSASQLQNGLYQHRFDLTQFFKNNGCLDGFVLEDGDSLICEFSTEVRGDIPLGNHEVEQLKGYFSFEQDDDFLTCGIVEATQNVIRIRGNQPSLTDPEFEQLCDEIQINLPFSFGHSGFGLFDYFPSEFRPAGRIDSILVPLPEGLEYLEGSAEVAYTWRAPNSLIATELMTESIANPTLIQQNGTPYLLFKNEDNWPNMDYTKVRCFYNLLFTLRPNCQLPDENILFSPETFFTENVWADDEQNFESDTEIGFFNLAPSTNFPSITLIDSIFLEASNIAQWTFQICNADTSQTLPNVWVGLESINGDLDVIEVLDNGNPLALFDYENSQDNWVQLDTLSTETCKTIQVMAQIDNCNADMLLIRRGFNCYEYPVAPDVGYGIDNYTCPNEEETDTLILEPVPFEVAIMLDNPIVCNGETNAVISVSSNFEPAGLTWQWSQNLPDDPVQYNLSAGMYEVTVSNGMGCEDIASIEVIEPEALQLSASITSDYNGFDVSCPNSEDGEASGTVSGGVLPYNYDWSNGVTDAMVQNLAAGMATVTVTDANGCQQVATLDLTAPPALEITASVEPALCHGTATGNIFTEVTGSAAPYTYVWQDGNTDENRTNITAGNWQLTVTDDNGCPAFLEVEVDEPEAFGIQFEVEEINCFNGENGQISINVVGGALPYQYLWNSGEMVASISNLNTGNYVVTITDSNGCSSTDSMFLDNPLPIDLNFEVEEITCENENNGSIATTISGGQHPITYQWNTGASDSNLQNLGANVYEVTITDAAGCIVIDSISLEEADFPAIDIEQLPISCFDGTDGQLIMIEAGATTDLTYSLDNNSYQEDPFFEGLSAGNYTVFVQDALGCMQSFDTHLANPEMLVVDLAPSIEIILGETLDLIPQTNQIGLSWEWSPKETLSCSDCESPTATPFSNTTYTVVATNLNNCTAMASIDILVNKQKDIYIPTAFSPNGDGYNDFLKIFPTASVAEISSFSIFNRWGGLVFEANNLSTDEEWPGWDGRRKGQLLPNGVFVYQLSLVRVDGKKAVKTGEVLILK